LLWTNPASVATTVSVLGSASTINVPIPQADATTNLPITEFANCYDIGSGCGEDGEFAAGSIVTSSAANVNTLSWASFTTAGNTGSATQTIDLDPTKTEIGTAEFTVTFTPDNGNAFSYTWYLTIDCTVTAITQPTAPVSGLTYSVYADPNTYDFTQSAYAQTPDCGYAYTSVFAWEGDGASAALETTAGALVVSTSLRNLAANHEVKLGNTLTIAANGPAGSTTFTPSGDSEKIVFTVTIEDPCLTATIPDADLQDSTPSSVTSITLTDGDAGTVTFSPATDSVTTLYSSTIGLCGAL
jgi:hypothetical protein